MKFVEILSSDLLQTESSKAAEPSELKQNPSKEFLCLRLVFAAFTFSFGIVFRTGGVSSFIQGIPDAVLKIAEKLA